MAVATHTSPRKIVDSECTARGFVRTTTWSAFELTISWSDRADSVSVLRATTLEAAKNEAREIRAAISLVPTFKGCKLAHVAHREVADVTYAFDAHDGDVTLNVAVRA